MDNLTHTLTAVAISQTGLNRKTRFATLTLILAANAPDLDLLWAIEEWCHLPEISSRDYSFLCRYHGYSYYTLGSYLLAGKEESSRSPACPLTAAGCCLPPF